MMPPAYFTDHQVMAWLVLESRRLWAEHGPCRALIGPLAHASLVMISLRQDYRTGYRVVQRVLAAGTARGYEPETSRARFLFALGAGPWFESLEDTLEQAEIARDGLLAGGDLQNAVFTYHASTPTLLDVAPTLERYLPVVEAGLALADQTGNTQTVAAGLPFRQLVRTCAGRPTSPVVSPTSPSTRSSTWPRPSRTPCWSQLSHHPGFLGGVVRRSGGTQSAHPGRGPAGAVPGRDLHHLPGLRVAGAGAGRGDPGHGRGIGPRRAAGRAGRLPFLAGGPGHGLTGRVRPSAGPGGRRTSLGRAGPLRGDDRLRRGPVQDR